jgi:hypothetical protein
MAIATFKLTKCTGTAAGGVLPTETDTSRTPMFLSSDIHSTVTTDYPIAIPATGTTYSYECWLRLECTVAPDNYCQTFKVFGPSAQPDSPNNKLKIYIGTTGTATTPTASSSSVATTQQNTNYYSSGTALAVSVIPGDAKIDAIGEKTNYIVLQLQLAVGAARGNMGLQPFYIQYDEV